MPQKYEKIGPGNQLWRLRKTHGRPRKVKSSAALWKLACDYFEWIEENPIWEQQLVTNRGDYTRVNVPHMHAMTIIGFCLHAGLKTSCYYEYRKLDEFKDVCEQIENIIYEQKFSGAAANMLNQAIIARDLGLKDKSEITGASDGPVQWVVEFVDAEKKDSDTK